MLPHGSILVRLTLALSGGQTSATPPAPRQTPARAAGVLCRHALWRSPERHEYFGASLPPIACLVFLEQETTLTVAAASAADGTRTLPQPTHLGATLGAVAANTALSDCLLGSASGAADPALGAEMGRAATIDSTPLRAKAVSGTRKTERPAWSPLLHRHRRPLVQIRLSRLVVRLEVASLLCGRFALDPLSGAPHRRQRGR